MAFFPPETKYALVRALLVRATKLNEMVLRSELPHNEKFCFTDVSHTIHIRFTGIVMGEKSSSRLVGEATSS